MALISHLAREMGHCAIAQAGRHQAAIKVAQGQIGFGRKTAKASAPVHQCQKI